MLLDYLAGEGGIALLEVNPGLIIWTTITFGVVLVVLRAFAWKPIIGALDERAEKVHSDIERAESIRLEAERKLSEYLEKLNGLRAEGLDIVQEARRDAEKLKNDMLTSARTEADGIKERSLREVKLAMDKALDEYHNRVVEISVAVASQILGKTLNAADHEKLIADSIKNIEGVN